MCASRTSGSRWMELIRFCRVSAVPVTAHAGAAGTGRGSGKVTGSIICPMLPSASTTTGLRYRPASSKASMVRSTSS